MELSLRRWRPRHLLAAWGAYWAGLIGVTLAPALGATWRATHLPEGHGSISASFGDGLLKYTVLEGGATTWAGAAPFGTVLLWLVGPPLVLWLLWLVARPRGAKTPHPAALGDVTPDALSPGTPAERDWSERPRERADQRHA